MFDFTHNLNKIKKAATIAAAGLMFGTIVPMTNNSVVQNTVFKQTAAVSNLAPVYESAYRFEKLSRLYNENTWTGKLYYLSGLTDGIIPESEITKVLSLVMDDFYWVRILALQKIYQCIKQHPEQYHEILRHSVATNLPSSARQELVNWIRLVKLKANGIIHESKAIRRFKKKQLKQYLDQHKTVNIVDFLKFLEHLRKTAVSMSQLYLETPDMPTSKLQIATWDSFQIEHKENNIPTLNPVYGALTRQPKLIAWQFLLDMAILNKRIEGKNSQDQITSLLSDLSDKSLITKPELARYQKRIDHAIANNVRTKKIDRRILEITVEIANHPKNQVEKGRVGAVLLTPAGKIIGAAFDGAPAALGPDTEHMHGEISEDTFIPKPNGEVDSKSLRWRFDWRRSPCAEKKALFQGLQAMQRGEISADDFFGAKIYSSRQPCYQCTLFLNQIGFRQSVSPGDIVFVKPGEVVINRDRSTSVIDKSCMFEHVFVQKVDVEATANKIKSENLRKITKELDIRDGKIPSKTLWRLYNDSTRNISINDFRYSLFDLRSQIRKENYQAEIAEALWLSS